MKKLFLSLLFVMGSAHAVDINNVQFGSGIPGDTTTKAIPVFSNDIFHAPQYLPYYPTAAIIWPRVVEVECENTKCDGYHWEPKMGRGEYLFFVVKPKKPIIHETVIYEVPTVIYKEVPMKKNNQ